MQNSLKTLVAVTTLIGFGCATAIAAESTVHAQLRRPIALVVGDEFLYSANRDSGSISIINTSSRKVVGELAIGKEISALTPIGSTEFLLATDFATHQLLLMKRLGKHISITQRLRVAKYPVSVSVTDDGRTCIVASLWSRRLSICELQINDRTSEPSPSLRLKQTIDLPFAPRVQLAIPQTKRFIVADSFANRLAIVDVSKRAAALSYKNLSNGHNIRGIAPSHDGRSIYFTHQILNSRAATTHEGVFWGGVIKNVSRIVPIADFTSSKKEISGAIYPLSKPTDGTGDPADILVTSQGRTLISLSGVNRIAVRPRAIEPFSSRMVGKRPTAMAEDKKNRIAFIANTLDDSISVFDLAQLKLVDEIRLGLPVKLSLAQRGEQHFYDASLSLDGWYSCHSCHTDGHTNGALNDNLGDGTYGAPKRILSLLGTGETAPWAWNGSASSFGDQIKRSIHVTMQGENSDRNTVAELTAYLASLTVPPSLAESRDFNNTQAIARGRRVFESNGCVRCHRPPFYTTPSQYDVGLTDEKGTTRFNPPSLRGVSQRGPYFHDNRARRLKDVFVEFGHGIKDDLEDAELAALLAFLNSL